MKEIYLIGLTIFAIQGSVMQGAYDFSFINDIVHCEVAKEVAIASALTVRDPSMKDFIAHKLRSIEKDFRESGCFMNPKEIASLATCLVQKAKDFSAEQDSSPEHPLVLIKKALESNGAYTLPFS